MRTLRLLQPISPAHCVRQAIPTLRLAHWLPPAQGALPGGRGLGVRCHPDRRGGGVGDCRPPRFLGNPDESSPGSTTPVGPLTETVRASGAAPVRDEDEGSRREETFEAQWPGVPSGCLRFVNGIAPAHARLASGCRPHYRAGLATRRVPTEGFQDIVVTSLPPSPGFAWRNVPFSGYR
jgi:hypothetical protein